MATFKFFHAAKANARIDELEKQLADVTKERDEACEASKSNSADISAAAEQLQKDLGTARQSIETITGQLNAANAAITAKDAEIAALNAKISTQGEAVKVQVSQQVAQTQAALGQPAMPSIPEGAKAAATNGATGLERLMAGCKAALDSLGFKKN